VNSYELKDMRQLPQRGALPDTVNHHLLKETRAIANAAHPKAEAAKRYQNARQTIWFKPVIEALQKLAGPGERCMFCSGGEAFQVEHFYPKAIFPQQAMRWENFLWACAKCNQNKGDQFPLDGNENPCLLNPLDENVWLFFYIDEYGNLTPRWDGDLDDFNPRAAMTREILALDRQALQESRQARLQDLKKRIRDSMQLFESGQLDKNALRERLAEWRQQPFQPDVADYFLNGPGSLEPPFSDYMSLCGLNRHEPA
jgi:hypothetical protein